MRLFSILTSLVFLVCMMTCLAAQQPYNGQVMKIYSGGVDTGETIEFFTDPDGNSGWYAYTDQYGVIQYTGDWKFFPNTDHLELHYTTSAGLNRSALYAWMGSYFGTVLPIYPSCPWGQMTDLY